MKPYTVLYLASFGVVTKLFSTINPLGDQTLLLVAIQLPLPVLNRRLCHRGSMQLQPHEVSAHVVRWWLHFAPLTKASSYLLELIPALSPKFAVPPVIIANQPHGFRDTT